jgi:fibronectin-binding autotransporter adhesin
VLPAAGTLTTKLIGMFDLNGYNQEVGGLAGDGGSINNGGFDNNVLSVNQAADTTYSGLVNGNVTLLKKGAGKLTLTSANNYRGGTVFEGGILSVSQASNLGYTSTSVRPDALRFKGGTLETTANMSLGITNGVTLDSAGGSIAPAASTTLTIEAVVTGIGSLTKIDAGTLILNNADNDYIGDTNVVEGSLVAGGAGYLAPASRHVISGDTASGTLDMNGFDQSIGSLASAGATPANANIVLGSNRLTVGSDDTSDAVYAGTITGTGTVRIDTLGAQTFAGADNSGQTWVTEVVRGQLSVAGTAKLGSGDVTLGVSGVSGVNDRVVFDLQVRRSLTTSS